MSQTITKIAIYGGAFDPVHIGHEAVIQHLMNHYAFDRVYVIPYALSAFNKHPVASGTDRLAMLNLVCARMPHCHVDARELRRPGCSYAIDTVLSIVDEHPLADLFIVLSTESLASFTRWKRWQALIKLARILCLSRVSAPLDLAMDLTHDVAAKPLHLDHLEAKRIFMDGFEPPSISSSLIRQGLQQGEAMKQYLNPDVCQYIQHHRLYHRPKDNP